LPAELRPQLLDVLHEGIDRRGVTREILAGVVVGVVALPLAIAFAIASGVRPEQGLYTAVVAGLAISVLSGSRVQIGGPTGAFVVLVLGIVQSHGYDGLAVATLMAGVMLIAMAFARMGSVIRFIPYPVTVGFTAGIAVVIAVGQIPDALGLDLTVEDGDFVPRLIAYAGALGTIRPTALVVTVLTVVAIRVTPRIVRHVPGPLLAIVAGAVATRVLGLDIETVGSRFGGVPTGLPSFHWPRVEAAMIPELVQPALAIALLAGIESLMSAVVADGMTGGKHRSNAELFAQGVANLASPLFGGIPATGAIARTATNVKNGGRTPVAGVVHALTLLIILTSVAPAGRLKGSGASRSSRSRYALEKLCRSLVGLRAGVLLFRYELDLFQEVPKRIGDGHGPLTDRRRRGLADGAAEQVARHRIAELGVGLCRCLVILRVASGNTLLEDRKLGLGSPILDHVLEDGRVERVEPFLDPLVGRPAQKCELGAARMRPHEEDECFLGCARRGTIVVVQGIDIRQGGLDVFLGQEVGEAFPDEPGEVITQLLGCHRLRCAKLTHFVGERAVHGKIPGVICLR
jgi:hypothetical protein